MILKQMLKSQKKLDQAFFALSDPTRRAMVDRLAKGEAALGDLAKPFDMSLPAVHQHLAVLSEAGLVTSEKKGRVRVCRLNAATLDMMDDWLARRRRMWQRRLDALEDFLEEE